MGCAEPRSGLHLRLATQLQGADLLHQLRSRRNWPDSGKTNRRIAAEWRPSPAVQGPCGKCCCEAEHYRREQNQPGERARDGEEGELAGSERVEKRKAEPNVLNFEKG